MSLENDDSSPLLEGPEGHGTPELRSLTDPRAIRALAHPVRIALIELLTLDGAMTATEAGERLGESATTCSFHLRQLAKYGFVEEAGGGKGRARPWKMTAIGMHIPASEDAETELATAALTSLFRERQLARFRTWIETRHLYPSRWRAAAGESEHVFYLTADELEALNDELTTLLLGRFRERLSDPATRPPGAVPVEMLIFRYPITPVPEA